MGDLLVRSFLSLTPRLPPSPTLPHLLPPRGSPSSSLFSPSSPAPCLLVRSSEALSLEREVFPVRTVSSDSPSPGLVGRPVLGKPGMVAAWVCGCSRNGYWGRSHESTGQTWRREMAVERSLPSVRTLLPRPAPHYSQVPPQTGSC